MKRTHEVSEVRPPFRCSVVCNPCPSLPSRGSMRACCRVSAKRLIQATHRRALISVAPAGRKTKQIKPIRLARRPAEKPSCARRHTARTILRKRTPPGLSLRALPTHAAGRRAGAERASCHSSARATHRQSVNRALFHGVLNNAKQRLPTR
eukprot:1406814-Pleurochrysis_carterae.AAC.5